MDYIDKLRIFRSVVELRSFTRAADMHGLARPVVSRAVADLEARFGGRLLHRTTRQVSLTETAERLYERCAAVLDELDALELEAQTQTREPEGLLRLVVHTTAALNQLVPLIAGFKSAHPKLRLDVTLTERPVDLVGEGYDIGIVVPYMLTSETTVVRLIARIPFVIVATPAYLRAHPRPATPADLADHPFVPLSPSLRRPALSFRVDGDILTVPFRFDISSNSPVFNREMVMHDFGIGVVPKTLVSAELASGALVPLLEDAELLDAFVEIKLAYANRALLPAKVKAFIDYTTRYCERENWITSMAA
ncbi:LysR family transcriptional regulator [Burkholderia pseudomultivorans]|uniref:LysR family transcriptional regulator n=1 Tax=Burkholderia pseudomultivorans TaxID=1207504 RepID=A0A132EV18_9BURK|nr:LysR family transcriptional regulator [Burkholderia pseudomultivorans]KWF08076.1 LysR family transcriptional regulator [Burkholderia pseudomultivorans]KWF59930.1 LysR family transcriptional regulator [Burkholderia pseudomultivorans]KWI50422.1 LysR family transcriptional regulator [Burkholderia pseudomultivorans]MBF5009193.1 LysR family transcriptional regulator [Burkholderia pseudomultivorans]